jgi:hypothetical protein
MLSTSSFANVGEEKPCMPQIEHTLAKRIILTDLLFHHSMFKLYAVFFLFL